MSFAATIVDEWVRAGISDAVIAPGSRSTPLAVALDNRMRVHVVLDERSASFMALGLALASGKPTVLTCTSGTAGAHFGAAVIEAHQAGVPLIVCTADRPPDLQGVGAPQTVDQVGLYGAAVRWSANPGVPDTATSETWRSLAARAVCEAMGTRPGPVHLNLMFREPLLDDDDSMPPGRSDGAPWHRRALPQAAPVDPQVAALVATAQRVLVVAGAGAPNGLTVTGVPVLSDHRSLTDGAIAHWDALLRVPGFADGLRPDLVVRVGSQPASKVLTSWLRSLDVPQIVIAPRSGWVDPQHNAAVVIDHDVDWAISGDPAYLSEWQEASKRAASAIDAVLARHPEITEPGVARTLLEALPAGSNLVTSSSMPVRDLEAFASPRPDVRVFANRGANGIDGVTSTATGVALADGVPTTLLIGDLAFLHDSNALMGLTRRAVDLTIVVVDNGGGGIFSFLPQHDELPTDQFETLFGTPQNVDLVALAAVHGIDAMVVDEASAFETSIRDAVRQHGVRLVVARTDRSTNVAVHAELNDAVAAVFQ